MSFSGPPDGAQPPLLSPKAPPPGTTLSQHFSGCFACGDEQAAGLHLVAVVGDGVSVVSGFTVTKAHQGAPSLAHGGLLAAAVDEAMGYLMTLVGEPAVTAHLEIDYRLPVPVGSYLTLHSAALAQDGRKIWTSVRGEFEDGAVAFTGQALFVIVPIEHFTSVAAADDINDSILSRYNP